MLDAIRNGCNRIKKESPAPLEIRWGLVRPYCYGASLLLRDSHPALCLPPLDDGVGKRQTQDVPIAPLSTRPESWQIVGKWVFEQETGKQKK